MAHLFKIEGSLVNPYEETLLISPFKEIWERDKSKGKEEALKEMAYMEMMTSLLVTNPYKGYTEEVREIVLIKDLFKNNGWQPDELVNQGMERIKQFQTEASQTYAFYSSAIKAKDTLQKFFNTVDLTKMNFKTGTPMYKPKELTSALLDVDKITANLDALKKKVEEELFEAVKVKGQKEISPFAKTDY